MDPVTIQQMTPGFRNYSTVYRTQSTFQSALGLGEFMSLVTPFLLHISLTSRRALIRIGAVLSLCLVFFVTLISNARSGMIGLIIDFGLYALYWGAVQWRRRKDSLLGPAIVLSYPVTAFAVLASTLFVGRIRRAVWGGGESASSSLARQIQYQMGLPKVFQNPIGHGMGRAGETLGFYTPGGLLTIDTYYLSVLLEYGIIGFIAFYSLILFSIGLGGRQAVIEDSKDREISFLAPATCALASFFIIKSVYSEQMNHPLYFMVMGMVVALSARLKAETSADYAEAVSRTETVGALRRQPQLSMIPSHQPGIPFRR
jgi:hypothetical protein